MTPSKDSVPSFLRGLPFFYGWLIVGIAMLSAFLGSGVNNVVMGVIFKPMSEDLGWSRTLTAGAITAGTVGVALLSPPIGRLADRIGPRLLIPSGAVAMGVLLTGVSLVREPWQFYATYVPARSLTQTLLYGVVPLTAVTNWFYLKRPRAMGLVSASWQLGSSVLAVVYQIIITTFGWRGAFVALGALYWILVVVPGVVILRRQPEDVGMLPDGKPAEAGEMDRSGGRVAGEKDRHGTEAEYSWTLEEALRSRAMWLLCASFTMAVLCNAAIAFHLAAYYSDLRIDPTLAAGAVSLYAFTGAVANGLWGFLAERVSARSLNLATLLLSAAGAVLLLQVRSPLEAYLFAAIFGLSGRGETSLMQILVAQYFGRRSYGAIIGVTTFFQMAGVGLGPLVAAASFDLSGTYQGIFIFFMALYVLSAVLIFLARKPSPPPIRTSDTGYIRG